MDADDEPAMAGDVDFGGPHTRPRPTLEPSPFGSSGGSASSPRPTNFLLSDLGGEIHTPRASRDFGDSGGTTPTASRPFGFPGAFGSGLSEGGAIGAGAIRSPTSMFDRGQEAAKSFSMQGESRNSLTSAGFGNESQQLYRGGTTNLSYLSSGEADSPFGSGSMRTWPAVATEVSQPHRMLQRPPGLAGPPGLSEPHAIDGIQPQMRLGSGGGDMMEQHVAGPQFGPFHPSASSPMAGTGESNRAFSRGNDQYGASLLSSLRLSSGVFGDSSLHDQGDVRGVSNRDLAELNTHSMAVSEMGGMRIRHAVDSPSVPWDNREPTTSRRIDIQARSKTPRSPKKSRDGRRKSEGRSDLRAKALEFSMDAINAFTPGSPMKPRRTDRGRKLASSINVDEALPPSADSSRSNSDKSAPRGKRRNQAADTGVASSFSSSSGNDCRRRGPVGQNNESSSQYGLPPGFEAGDGPVKPAMQETSKLKRREENIVPSRTSASRRNSTRGNDKVAGTTRRQVYREKQVKENVKDVSLTKEVTPNRSQSRTAINIPQERRSSGDDEGLEVKKNLPKQNVLLSSMEGASSVTKPVDAIKATQSTDTSSQDAVTISNGAGVSISGNDNSDAGVDTSNRLSNDGVTSVPVVSDASDEASQEETATFYDRDSASSSEVLEDVCVAAREQRDPTDSPELDEVLSPLESSESETDRGQSATEDKLTSSTKPVADDNLPAPQSKSESSSAPAAAAEKKTTLKEHRKEKSKKDKGEKKKTARGKKDKRASSSISKTGDGLSGSANQDKILDDLAARGTPLSTQISQGLRKGCSAAAAAGLAAFVTMRRGCAWTASRLNVKGVLGTAFSYVESVLAVVFSVLLLLSLHAASWFILYISVGTSMGTGMLVVRFSRPAVLHERTHGNGDDVPCNFAIGVLGGGNFPP
ncbi:unnamed protein product [Phytophthora lilii]|uniref:Unnamed protein product n=1 Tax=Phytophthora lilii TaxID=2077276 RepID=A0A9W6U5T4_9STRA|nr:unnamed protein product [Phytophthora lilii]